MTKRSFLPTGGKNANFNVVGNRNLENSSLTNGEENLKPLLKRKRRLPIVQPCSGNGQTLGKRPAPHLAADGARDQRGPQARRGDDPRRRLRVLLLQVLEVLVQQRRRLSPLE